MLDVYRTALFIRSFARSVAARPLPTTQGFAPRPGRGGDSLQDHACTGGSKGAASPVRGQRSLRMATPRRPSGWHHRCPEGGLARAHEPRESALPSTQAPPRLSAKRGQGQRGFMHPEPGMPGRRCTQIRPPCAFGSLFQGPPETAIAQPKA